MGRFLQRVTPKCQSFYRATASPLQTKSAGSDREPAALVSKRMTPHDSQQKRQRQNCQKFLVEDPGQLIELFWELVILVVSFLHGERKLQRRVL